MLWAVLFGSEQVVVILHMYKMNYGESISSFLFESPTFRIEKRHYSRQWTTAKSGASVSLCLKTIKSRLSREFQRNWLYVMCSSSIIFSKITTSHKQRISFINTVAPSVSKVKIGFVEMRSLNN